MLLIRTSLLLLFVWSCITHAWTTQAQSIRYTVEHITSDEGFPGAAVHAIHEDDLGFLWFGTDRGLVRFDGMAYRLYRHIEGDPYSLGGKGVVSILVDDSGYFWLGTDAGITRFDPRMEHFENFEHHPTVSMLLSSQNKGLIWLATSKSFSSFHIPTGTFEEINPTPMDSISAILAYAGYPHGDTNRFGFGTTNGRHALYEDKDGRVWAGMNWGASIYNPSTNQYKRVLPDETYPIYDTGIWPRGRSNAAGSLLGSSNSTYLWLASRGGLHQIDLSDHSIQTSYVYPDELLPLDNLPRGSHLAAFNFGKSGNLWVAARDGFYSFDPASKEFTTIFLEPFWAEAILEDQNGVVWVGARDGLRKVEKSAYPFYSYQDPATGNGIFESRRGIIEDKKGNILISSRQGLISIDRDNKQNPKLIEQETIGRLQSGHAALFIDSKGIKWLGGGGVLDAFNPTTKSIQSYGYDPNTVISKRISNGGVNHIIEDKAGNIWVALIGGVSKYDPATDTFEHFRHDPNDENSLGDNQGIRMYIPPSNPEAVWIATLAGPTKYVPAIDSFYNYHSDAMEGLRVIHEDHKGRFWMGSNHGLHLFDRETGDFKTWTESDGLANDAVKSLLEDDHGYLWLGTFNGLSRFNPETESFKNFYKKDGLPDNNFTESGFLKTSAGEFFFMVRRESPVWFSFHPDEINEVSAEPSVVFTQLDIKGVPASLAPNSPLDQSIAFTEKLSLAHNQDELTIHYTGLKSRAPDNLHYQYMLAGYDDAWVNAGPQKSARYNFIPPGEYTFLVRSALEGNPWSKASSLAITIQPPWWRTMGAFMVYGLLFVVGVIAFDRGQRRRIREAERMRAEREHAKEIEKTNAELQLALLELRNAQDQLIHTEKMASLGQLTAGIAHEIKNPLNFVNNFSRLSVDAVGELVELLEEDRGLEDEDVSDLIDTLKMNAQKIQKHGVRADNIVRSMLAHSRTEPGQQRPIDLNKLVEEYTNLAFHSWKASQRSHSDTQPEIPPTIERSLDTTIGEVMLVPQDIGRVIINLVNNALDEVGTEDGRRETGVVRVATTVKGKWVEVRIGDNGRGIPVEVRHKIFEPFFTTKPTGSGTGLGLSLSHDIVVKGHGGKFNVESTEGKGAEFIIRLPR